jgi:hypothetical protein
MENPEKALHRNCSWGACCVLISETGRLPIKTIDAYQNFNHIYINVNPKLGSVEIPDSIAIP